MSLKSTYKILPKYKLLIEYHKGILETNSYIEFKRKLTEDSLFDSNMNYFINFQEVKFNVTREDIEEFVSFMNSKKEILGKRRLALITNTPNQVVSTTIYKSLKSDLLQDVEIFSTNQEALKWLLKNPFQDNLIEILSEMEKSL